MINVTFELLNVVSAGACIGGEKYESGNCRTNQIVYGSRIWHVYSPGIICNSGMWRMGHVRKRNDSRRTWVIFRTI